jgi:hypothetical protein
VSITNPGTQTGTEGQAIPSLQIHASDTDSGTLGYAATGLPAGLSISATTGKIIGTPTAAGSSRVSVEASDSTGGSASATFTWTVGKASPSVLVTAPTSGTEGSAVGAGTISAVLSAGFNLTGTITFRVFGPEASAPTSCSSGGTVVGTASVAGNGSYKPSAGFMPASTGDYWWYASYGGDANNNSAASACAASMAKTVVTNPPPQRPSGTTISKVSIDPKKHSARFTFTAVDSTSFQCALIVQPKSKHKKQPMPHFVPCTSSKTYEHLKARKYTFEVRGVNAAGADPNPARRTFKI